MALAAKIFNFVSESTADSKIIIIIIYFFQQNMERSTYVEYNSIAVKLLERMAAKKPYMIIESNSHPRKVYAKKEIKKTTVKYRGYAN